MEDRREVIEGNRDEVMLGTALGLEERKGTVIEPLGFVELPLPSKQCRQRRQVGRHRGMPAPEQLRAQHDGVPRERLATQPVAGRMLEPAEIVVDVRGRVALTTCVRVEDGQRTLIAQARVHEAREVVIAHRQQTERRRHREMRGAMRSLDACHDRFEHRRRVLVAPLGDRRVRQFPTGPARLARPACPLLCHA